MLDVQRILVRAELSRGLTVITEVVRLNVGWLCGCHIDVPVPGSRIDGYETDGFRRARYDVIETGTTAT